MQFYILTAATGTFLLLLSSLSTVNGLPNAAPVPEPVDAATVTTGSSLNKREPQYCFKGWNQKNYNGGWAEACCWSRCCYFTNDLLNNNLLSAKATVSPGKGVILWTNSDCTGTQLNVDFAGWYDLSKEPALYSMSIWY